MVLDFVYTIEYKYKLMKFEWEEEKNKTNFQKHVLFRRAEIHVSDFWPSYDERSIADGEP